MSSPAPSPRIAVLGAGITGLTAAWHLQRAGLTPVVFEKGARVGGAIGAVRSDGWLHELGPNSLLEGAASVADFIDAAGLRERRLYASDEAQQRYIVRGGRLVAMPASPPAFLTTGLFSWRAKLGLLGELWRPRGPHDREESVAEFVLRRLGREFLDYAINPFVGGVYAGDPARLSVRHGFPKLYALEREHGSLLRGSFKRRNTSGGPKGRIFSFPHGLEELPETLAASLGAAVRRRHEVRTVSRQGADWRIEFESAGERQSETFASVVCALPADALAALRLEDAGPTGALQVLRDIVHPPVASVLLGYRRTDIRHPLDGFGFLVPEVERRSLLGSLFSSTLFPGRAPEGFVAPDQLCRRGAVAGTGHPRGRRAPAARARGTGPTRRRRRPAGLHAHPPLAAGHPAVRAWVSAFQGRDRLGRNGLARTLHRRQRPRRHLARQLHRVRPPVGRLRVRVHAGAKGARGGPLDRPTPASSKPLRSCRGDETVATGSPSHPILFILSSCQKRTGCQDQPEQSAGVPPRGCRSE